MTWDKTIIKVVGPPYDRISRTRHLMLQQAKLTSTRLIPLQKTRLHEDIVLQLKDRIVSREIMPGEKLPSERELAEVLNVNRSTVREALNKLESMELVEIRHGEGVFVRDYLESGSLELLRHLLIRNGEPDVEIVVHLSNLRKMIVPGIARHAALNRTQKEIDELEAIVFHNEGVSIVDRDWQVHNVISRASGNLALVFLLNSFTNLVREYSDLYFSDEKNIERSELFHRDIYEAIRRGDPEEAERIMREIYDYAEEGMFKSFESALLKRGKTSLSRK